MLVKHQVRNFQMMLDTEDIGMSTNLLKGMRWEGDSADILTSIIEPNWTCIEMGACLGFYMLVEAVAGANVYAIEPDPDNVKIMQENIKINKLDNVKIFQIAIEGENEIRIFRPSPGRSDRGRLSGNSEDGIDVKVMTLDSFVKEQGIERVDIIRSDIEGSEVAMIKKGQKTLSNMPVGSWIFIDLHPVRFKRPYKEIEITVRNILSHGFAPKHFISLDDVNRLSTEQFITACCRPTFPKVFFQKIKRVNK